MSLPAEIIHQIFFHLSILHDQATLASSALVNRQLNQIATPLLWRWLKLNLLCASEDVDTPTLDLSTWDEHLQNMVHVLDIKTHERETCESANVKSLNLPNLKTLRLHIDTGPAGYREIHFRGEEEGQKTSCRLIQNLRPKTIVYRESININPSFYLDPEYFCPTIWSQVDTLVYLVPPTEYGTHFVPHHGRDLKRLLPKLEKIFWIFDPTPMDPDAEGEQGGLYGQEFNLIYDILINNPHIKFTIVNVGCTQMRLPRRHRLSYENTLGDYWQEFNRFYWDQVECSSVCDDEEDDTEEFNYPYLLTIEEFIEQEEWYELLEPQEIEGWVWMNEEIEERIPTWED